MKIIVSNYDEIHNPYYSGGGAVAIHEVARRLAVANDVTVVCGRYTGSDKTDTVDGVRYFRVGPAFLGPILGQLAFHLLLWYYAASLEYDVWIESFTPPLSGSMVPVFTRRPVIGCAYLLPGQAMASKYKLPFDKLEKITLRPYRHAIALSEYQAHEMTERNQKMGVRVIPIGLDRAFLTRPVAAKENYILYLGRIDKYHKGLDLMLESFKEISKKSDVDLHVAGGGVEADVKWFAQAVSDMGLQGRVKILGRVDFERKLAIMERAKVLLFPSRFEGFGTVPLEGFALGTPVVCFDIPDLNWIPTELSRKVPAFDTGKFTEAVLSLLADEAELARLGSLARSFAQKSDWDAVVKEYESLIKDAMEAKR